MYSRTICVKINSQDVVDTEKGKEWGKNVEMNFKKPAVVTGVLFAMLLPGIILDVVYRLTWFQGLRRTISQIGITYDRAFQILSSQAGILMTMVSLFLTINIYIAERSEKKVYGILRKELFGSDEGCLYIWVGRMGFVAPALFILSLNLYFCCTGYLLFFYCYLFLIIYYLKHKNSFGLERDKNAVITKIIRCLPEETVDLGQGLRYRVLLENIGRNTKEDGNWLEIEDMYYRLLECVQDYDMARKYQFSYYFYLIIFWKYQEDGAFSIQILKRYMEKMDLDAEDEWQGGKKAPLLWGMLKAAHQKAEEAELITFFQWFLDFPGRSKAVMDQTEKVLPVTVLNEQAAMLLVLLECRMNQRGLKSEYMAKQVKILWSYGKVVMRSGASGRWGFIRRLVKVDPEDAQMYEDILKELESDSSNNSQKCVITNL